VTSLSRTIAIQAPRPFSTTFVQQKTAKDSVKDGLKSVDRAVSDNVVLPGLDAAVDAKEKIQDKTGTGKAKAEELKAKAKVGAEEAKDKAKEKL